MSSPEGAATTAEAAARCLLCSVGCPVRALRVGPDQYVPDYVPRAGYAGLCGRGSVLVELLDHPERLRRPRRGSDGSAKTVDLETAAAEMAETLRRGASPVLVADGTLDLDSLAAVGRLARQTEARWTVYVPPGDAGLVHGLDASGAAVVGPDAVADADALLLVGDVFAAQPVAAHWVFAARDANPRMARLVVAGADTATAKFATARFEPPLETGGFAPVVAAIRTGQADDLPDGAALAGWKEQLASAARPAIVVTAELGYADGRALADEVAALAAETGARLCALTACGNAWGAMRVAAAGGGACPAEMLREGPDAVVAVGCDLPSAYGSTIASPVLERAKEVVWVGPLAGRTADRAALTVPAAFTFETSGRALLGPGRLVDFGPLMAPPAGVPSVATILEMAGVPGDGPADVSAPCEAPAMPSGAGGRAGDAKGLVVAPASDAVQYDDGSMTGRAAWPQAVRPRAVLAVAASDAEAAGLADGHTAVLDGPGGSAEVDVQIRPGRRAGQAWVSRGFADVRDAFGWSWDGHRPGEPVRMEVRKPS
ncbi:MAG: hypothetical protein R6X20_17260 [Phycisphaerae bacterium]